MEKYTDQTFFYKQTPVNYDGIAKFTSIKGNTLGWNQLVSVRFPSRTTTGGIIYTNNGDGSFTLNGTATGQVDIRISTTDGTDNLYNYPTAKYLLICDGLSSNVQFIIMSYPDYVRMATFTESPTLSSLPITGRDNCFLLIRIANGTTLNNVKLRPQLFNLTAMFGSGNEPTTVEEFTSLFPLPYYDYNQGTLIPFSGNGIKTTGKNLLESQNVGSLTGVTISVDNGVYTLNGASANYQQSLSTTTFTLQKGTYTLNSNGGVTNTVGVQLRSVDGITTYASSLSNASTFTLEQQTTVKFRIIVYANTTFNNYIVSPQLEIGSSASDYEPYTESTLSLPISTYFPTGMKSAGSVYDELTESKAITRIGAVDLRTLTWNRSAINEGYAFVSNEITDMISTGNVTTANALCPPYTLYMSGNGVSMANNKTFRVGGTYFGTRRVIIRDDSYTDATAFKQAMTDQNVKLYYELATETETDAEDIFYKFYADGTEQLLPVNGASPTTAPIIADIEYYDSTEGDSLYRRFWLINGDGERWDLTDKEFKSFLNNPTGLGFRKTIEITRYGEKANKNNEVYDFPQPSGELLFYDTYNSTRYDKYNKFIRFLMSQPITLYYMIPVSYISGIANIFTLDCDVTEVQKTESKTDHILTSSIVFNGLGFYEGDEISVNGTTDTYTLTNEGDFPVGFEITVEGSLTKPYITLSQDGELYGEARFDSETAFNSLYLNSNDGEQNIILQQGGSVIPNPLSYQDLSISNGSIYVTFVKLAKGVSELSIGVESGSISNVNIKYSPKYRSV